LDDTARVQTKGATPPILGGIKDFLRIHAAGNKSGALQLTMFDFTIRRGDERLTKGGVASAVQEGDGQIGEGCLKHPVFNLVRLINMLIGAVEGDPGRRGCAWNYSPKFCWEK
jgi:hypothetical protein